MAHDVRRWIPGLLAMGLFLLVWGGKLVVIDRFGTDLPWWDDWGAIGGGLLIPVQQGTLDWREIWAPHNEHRIVGTRVLNLALFLANGQWDARLECVANAGLHALIVVTAFLAGCRLLPLEGQLAWFGVLAALTVPPVVWENIIRGFDSQHYLLIGSSLAAIVLLLTSRSRTGGWWIGLGCAGAALFTMGSGLVASGVVVVVLLTTTPRAEWWPLHRWTLLACLMVAGIGLALSHEVPAHAAHRAQTVREFTVAFWHHLQWPLVQHPLFGAVSWLPWAWLAWRCVRRDPAMGSGERAVVAAGLWALTHYAAMAWFRGSLQPWPPVRGLENVVVGLAVNALALLLAYSRMSGTRWRRVTWRVAAGAGLATGLFGLQTIVRENLTVVLPELAAQARRVEANVREFVRTGDRGQLDPQALPYPDADGFAGMVSLPEMQAILPPSVRRSVPLVGSAEPNESFGVDGLPGGLAHPAGRPVFGSFVAAGAADEGEWGSEPIQRGQSAYWMIDTFRSAPGPSLALELRAADGRLVAPLFSADTGLRQWRTVVAAVSDETVVVVARDRSATAWLAFTAPVEVGGLSLWARRAAARGGWFVALGALAAVAGWGLVFHARQS